jgi:(S)-ureidoglycine-glyoxylate aminotransferase
VLLTLAALEQVLRRGGVSVTAGSGVGSALDFYGASTGAGAE